MFDFTVNKEDILKDPIVEHSICSFASSAKGYGCILAVTNMVTKEVHFKVVAKTHDYVTAVEHNTPDLCDAITLYNLLTV